MPSIAARPQAEKLLNDLFKKEFAGLDSSAKRIEMARLLLKQAGEQRAGTADHYVLLDKARDLAMVAGDVDFTCELIDTLRGYYQIDDWAVAAASAAARRPETMSLRRPRIY